MLQLYENKKMRKRTRTLLGLIKNPQTLSSTSTHKSADIVSYPLSTSVARQKLLTICYVNFEITGWQ